MSPQVTCLAPGRPRAWQTRGPGQRQLRRLHHLCCASASPAAQPSGGSRGGAGARSAGSLPQPAAPPLRPSSSSSPGSGSSGNAAAAVAALANATAPTERAESGPAVGAACRVRPAESSDYWAVGDLHACAFYPRSTPFYFAALRADRVISLQVGLERQHDFARFLCLVAEGSSSSSSNSSSSSEAGRSSGDEGGQPSSSSASSSGIASSSGSGGQGDRKPVLRDFHTPAGAYADRVDLGPLMDFFVRLFFPPAMRQNYAATYNSGRLCGAVVVDTLGDFLPPKRVRMPNGSMRDVPRARVAYLSNLAVAPCMRRSGVGSRLVEEAEQAAAEWGCTSVALHVDPTNIAAVEMYRRAGYRKVSEQPEWQRILEGRSKPLVLMMRLLPGQKRQLAQQRWRQLLAEAAAREEEAERARRQEQQGRRR